MTGRFLKILTELHDHGVDFVIVGGVAVALHGGSRATFDLDIVPSLAPDSWQAAVDLLWSLGARPRIPEPLERIRDVEQVRRWRLDKNMLALNFHTPDGRTEVDLLVGESDAFSAFRQRATEVSAWPVVAAWATLAHTWKVNKMPPALRSTSPQRGR